MVAPWFSIEELNNPSDPYAEYAVDGATYLLWALSGRKYHGVSTITEQYVCPSYDIPAGCSRDDTRFRNLEGIYGYIVPSHLSSSPQALGVRFRLRQQPVRKILSLSIGDTVIPSANYYIRNSSDLVITDSELTSLCDAPTVEYKYGVGPPSAGRLAAIELANELVKSYNNETCALPEKTTSITRQGLSIEVYDPQEFLNEGRLGLPHADRFIAASNPTRALAPAKVWSPDLPRGYSKR